MRWQKYRCGALLRWLGSNLLLTTCHHSGCTIPPSFSWPPRHSQYYYSEKTESRPNTCHCQNYKKSQKLQQVLAAARESVFSQYQCQWLQVSFNLLLCGLLWGVWFLFNWFNISSKKESTKSRIAATTRWFCSISVFKQNFILICDSASPSIFPVNPSSKLTVYPVVTFSYSNYSKIENKVSLTVL